MVIGLHVKTQPNAVNAAQQNLVRIMHFDIIYKFMYMCNVKVRFFNDLGSPAAGLTFLCFAKEK